MQVAVLGTGALGRTIAPRPAGIGHVVRLGTAELDLQVVRPS